MKTVHIFSLVAILVTTGCSGIRGYGESHRATYSDICVVENEKVTVPDFEEDLVSQLEDRKLKVRVVEERSQCKSPAYLTYTAFRSMGIVSKVKLSLYEEGIKVAYIDWDSGRSPMPPKISEKTYKTVEFWQTAEALAGLFGEIQIE
ncbi:hypothetical protein [Vibrio sp. FF145]|uniref:hypothetical protein n=1 Tax=Vibrio sp. FF145 TaxID=3230013 RepID=UPI00352F65FF